MLSNFSWWFNNRSHHQQNQLFSAWKHLSAGLILYGDGNNLISGGEISGFLSQDAWEEL